MGETLGWVGEDKFKWSLSSYFDGHSNKGVARSFGREGGDIMVNLGACSAFGTELWKVFHTLQLVWDL